MERKSHLDEGVGCRYSPEATSAAFLAMIPGRLIGSRRGGVHERADDTAAFHEVDWRVVRNDACAHFRTGSFAAGVALLDAIGRLADATDHHPDVDLRSDGVTVRLRTDSGDGLSEREVALAQQISAAARELGVPVDPTSLQIVQIAIDALVIPDVMPFWRAVLGYREVGDEDLIDPLFQGPPVWFQQMDAPPTVTGSISTSMSRTTRRRRASRRRLPLVAT